MNFFKHNSIINMSTMLSTLETQKNTIEKVIPTTPSQIEIWLACKMGGKEANKAYNESISVKLKGKLQVGILQEAFLKVLERHDAMRAVVSPNGKSFLVYSSYSLPIRMRDISGLKHEEKEIYTKKHAEQTGTYHFNLTRGPLYVLDLIKLEEESHLLTFTGHHIVFDGWSLGIMLEELALIYSNLVEGSSSHLPEADRFGEYAKEFYNLTRKATYKNTKNFWKAYLSDPVPNFILPADLDVQAGRTYAAIRHEQWIENDVIDKSKALGARFGASLNLALLAMFEIFLSEWTSQQDIIVGMPVSGQVGLNKNRLIGHCVNLLPLRSSVDPQESFSQYLKKRKEDYYQSLDYSFISFGEMIKDLPLPRNPSRIPLVPVTFNIDNEMGAGIKFKGLNSQLISNPKAFSNFEIILNLFKSSEGHVFEWTYNTSLFSHSKIEKAAQAFNNMIEAFIEKPNEKIADITKSLRSSQKEVQASIAEFKSLGGMIADKLSVGKDKIAVCSGAGSFSYDQLQFKVNCIAAQLIARGGGPGKIVGVHLERSIDLVASALAVIRIGACYLPIDSEYPEDRVRFMLQDVGVQAFITDNLTFSWGELSNKKIAMDNSIYVNPLPDFKVSQPEPNDPLIIVYTSGSTGEPKGVALSQQNLTDFLIHFKDAPGCTEADRVLGLSSISFDMSFMELILPIVYGGSLHILDRFERRDSREIVRILNSGNITKLYATPSHLKSILNYGLTAPLNKLTIISAGETLHSELAKSLVSVAGKVYNIYGPTEATIFSNIKEITKDIKEITIGKPVQGTSILLIDDQGKLVTETGKMGEIYIGGKGVGLGYLNRTELTAQKFVDNPLGTKNGRYYRTGDLATWTYDGELICKGRIDHQVKIRGQRIELSEIENSIALDSDVEHVVVAKTIDENGNDGLTALVSFKKELKISMDSQLWIAECKTRLRKKLPTYMVPGHFIIIENFELNQNGKVDRKLALNYVGSTGQDPSVLPDSKADAQQDGLLSELFQIWNEFLDVAEDQLDFDFFQLGGHSLMAVDLISEIEKRFGVNLPLSILFEYSTVNSLARRLTEICAAEVVESGILVKFKEGDPKKVLFFVHGVGLNPLEINTLINHMDEDQTIWGLQSPSILSQKTPPLDNIEDIATLYISEIKKLGYRGSYKLLGNSFGGQIAFEMSKQLIKDGEEVGFLGMIDTVASIGPERMNSILGNAGVLAKKLLFEISFLADSPVYYFNYRFDYLKDRMNNSRRKNNLSDAGGLKERIYQIEKVNMTAWERYKHEYIDTAITLFLAEKRTFYVSDFKHFGWSDYASRIDTFYMPGDHASMLKPPYGAEFSKKLQSLLNSSNK